MRACRETQSNTSFRVAINQDFFVCGLGGYCSEDLHAAEKERLGGM